MPWTENRHIFKKILNPSPTLQTNSQIQRVLSMLADGSRIADLGAGGRKITPDTVTVDFVKIGATSVIADIHNVPLKDESVDCIFCTGTLEHVEYPEAVLREIVRVLKRDGLVYIDVPFMQCYHPDPVDYWRFTISGLELICSRNGLLKIGSGVNIGTASALTWVLMAFSGTMFHDRTLNRIFSTVFSIVVSPLKYLDKITVKREGSIAAASAFYFIGQKR